MLFEIEAPILYTWSISNQSTRSSYDCIPEFMWWWLTFYNSLCIHFFFFFGSSHQHRFLL